ncbi:unnamed protein product [Brassica oleracea var. botrytis]|uniref:BnaC08g47060D protein n=2 Tax=Brassica TaxID=3705 RepID=A0A078ITU3_BRANA|nr:hypothetical protein F2Q69_00058941 [Brassica cretica]CDY52463.1 BnaC08g47060D [Brassica napus]
MMDLQSPDVEPITAKILPFWPLDFWDQDIVDYWLMVSLPHSGYEGKDAFKGFDLELLIMPATLASLP